MGSAVGVNDRAGRGTAAPAGHLERVDDDLRGDPISDRAPHDAAAERVDHRSAGDPSDLRAVLRDIAEPEPVRPIGMELALHEVLMRRSVGGLQPLRMLRYETRTSPLSRMSRATRLRPTWSPRPSRNSARTRGAP